MPEGTLPLSFNLIHRYQREEPFLTEKLKCAEYSKGSFRGGRSNIYIISYKDKIVIPQKLQKYVVKWYHTYLLHPGLDKTEVMIFQHLYWKGIKYAVYIEVTYCDTYQRTKRSTNKYDELPAKLAGETLRNKLCVNIIVPYKILRKAKEPLILK